MYRNILVPVDGSSHSDNAVLEAARLAKASSGTLVFLHVLQPQHSMYSEGLAVVATSEEKLERKTDVESKGRSVLDKAVALAQCSGSQVRMTTDASPSHAILEAASNGGCDVIVMGARRMGGVSGALLGSQTQKVLEKATVPVLVVH